MKDDSRLPPDLAGRPTSQINRKRNLPIVDSRRSAASKAAPSFAYTRRISRWHNVCMFTADELRQAKIFACLSEAECARMAQIVADVRIEEGEWLIREGETPWFYVLFEGRLRIAKDILGRQTDFDEFDFKEGDFLGEVPLLLGSPVFASVRALTQCRVARLNRQQFQHLIQDSKEAGARILQSLNERLMRVQRHSIALPTSRVLIFGRNGDADCHDIRAFLSANRISYEWVDRQPEGASSSVLADPHCLALSIDGQLFTQ